MTDQELLAEITNDPTNLGYDETGVEGQCVLINAAREGITFPVIVPVGTILEVFGMAPFRIAAMADPDKTAWFQVLANIRSLKEGFKPTSASVQALLTAGVAASVITSEERAYLESLGVRLGSRAEQLWGEGHVVALNDLARAT